MKFSLLTGLCAICLCLPIRAQECRQWDKSQAAGPVAHDYTYTWERLSDNQFACWFDGQQVGGYSTKTDTWRPLSNDGEWQAPCDLPDEMPLPPGVSVERKRPHVIKRPGPKHPKPMPKPRSVGATEEDVDELDSPSSSDTRSIQATAPHAEGSRPIFGVNRDRVPERELCRVAGPEGTREVKKAELIQAMNHRSKKKVRRKDGDIDDGPDLGALVDQSKWLRLSVIGSQAERAPVMADLKQAPELAPYRDCLAVQSYEPNDWAVATSGAPAGGRPEIIIEAAPAQPGGPAQVLWRETSYQGPLALAGALRQVDPNYDPSKDPGPDRDGGQELSPATLLLGAIVLGGIVIVAIAIKKKKG